MKQKNLSLAVENRIRGDLQTGWIDGASVSVVQKGETLCENHFGTATGDSLFRLASVSKALTGAVMMYLQEQGCIRTEDPVCRYIPGADSRITIHHLLTHSSGLSQTWYADHVTDAHRASHRAVVDYTLTVPLAFAPGSKAEYSPVAAYGLLSEIAQQVTGMPYSEVMQKYLLDPCQMQDTTFTPTERQWTRLVPMHDRVEGKAVTGWTKEGCVFEGYPAGTCLAGAGLVSSLQDCKNFAKMLLNRGSFAGKQVLTEASVACMSAPQVSEQVQPGTVRWGYGLRAVVSEAYGHLPVGCFGMSGAYGCHFWVDPKNELFAVYLKNSRLDGGTAAVTAKHLEEDVYANL